MRSMRRSILVCALALVGCLRSGSDAQQHTFETDRRLALLARAGLQHCAAPQRNSGCVTDQNAGAASKAPVFQQFLRR